MIATDNTTWAKRYIRSPDWNIHFTADYYDAHSAASSGRKDWPHQLDPVLFDFTVLSHCDHAVVDYGTFSFWTAYLTGGHVFLPQYYTQSTQIIDIVPQIIDSGLLESRYHFVRE